MFICVRLYNRETAAEDVKREEHNLAIRSVRRVFEWAQ